MPSPATVVHQREDAVPLRRLAAGLLLGAALGWLVGLLRAPEPRLPGEPW